MKKTINTVTSFLFATLGFAPVLLILFFSLKENSIRHKMKERLESSILHSITLNKCEIQWVKPGKEIWVNGKMFDIKCKEEKGGVVTFKGLYDEEETILKKNLQESWEKNKKQQNQLIGQIFQSLSNLFHSYNSWMLSPYNIKSKKELFYLSPLAYCYSDILTPPPKFDYKIYC